MDRVILNVAMGPHIHNGSRTRHIMNGILFALLPAAIFGCIRYGSAGISVLLTAVSSAIVFEWLSRVVMRRSVTIGDNSALVQGLMLGMILPPNSSFWFVIIGTFLMIVIGKQIFGGIGGYPFNPIAIATAMLMVSYPTRMSSHFTMINHDISGPFLEPLAALKSFGPAVTEMYGIKNLFLGIQNGGVGTGAVFLLLIGAIFVILRGDIPWRVSISFIAGVYLAGWMFHAVKPETYAQPIFHLFTGMTLFAGFFLITDATTCPVNRFARILYGLLAGVLVILIRNIGMYHDGSIFAVLILNLFHPLLDRIHKPVIGLDVKAIEVPE